MPKEKFGITVSQSNADSLNPVVENCQDVKASRSEIIDTILTVFLQSDRDHSRTVRERLISRDEPVDTTQFGISVDQSTDTALEPIVEDCKSLDARRSDVIDVVLSMFFEADNDHEEQVRELIVKRRNEDL